MQQNKCRSLEQTEADARGNCDGDGVESPHKVGDTFLAGKSKLTPTFYWKLAGRGTNIFCLCVTLRKKMADLAFVRWFSAINCYNSRYGRPKAVISLSRTVRVEKGPPRFA
eukprot:GEMP01081389.1.p1 GENE.GEMP01081389.1~~GEMP01081389.1.p1  ORF type:complete len:111 (+),score=11.59 GEMP01081389.1:697-1029(+)